MSLAISAAFPAVCPFTLAVGTAFTHGSHFLLARPVVGALYQKSLSASKPEDVLKSHEAASAAIATGTSIASSVLQTYGVAALLKLAGSTSAKGASIVGSLLFVASAGPDLVSAVILQKQPLDTVLAQVVVQFLDTVGLALAVQYYWNSRSSVPAPIQS